MSAAPFNWRLTGLYGLGSLIVIVPATYLAIVRRRKAASFLPER